jgi:alpha-galactosidase
MAGRAGCSDSLGCCARFAQSWNHFGGSVSAEVLKTTADSFVALGLKDVGYRWINTDVRLSRPSCTLPTAIDSCLLALSAQDCWSELARDNATHRIIPAKNFGGTDATMKDLSAYIKSKGMSFGIYGAAGQTTCAGRAGGLYHEYIDAQTYADWGALYLKYDDCGQNNINSYAKFSAMRDGLNRTGIPIVFSYEPHLTKPIAWTSTVGNLWRTGHDIGSQYGSMFSELVIGNSWASLGGPGHWNDDDMLEVGNKGLTIAEQRTHFALWCMVKSPLLIGSDVRSIANDSLALLKNTGEKTALFF